MKMKISLYYRIYIDNISFFSLIPKLLGYEKGELLSQLDKNEILDPIADTFSCKTRRFSPGRWI